MNDATKRALHTFWQALAGTLLAAWAASGIDISQIKDVDAAKKAGLAVAAALGAAVLSAAKTAILGYLDQRKVLTAVSTAAGPAPSGTPAVFTQDPSATAGVSFDPLSSAGATGTHPAPTAPPAVT